MKNLLALLFFIIPTNLLAEKISEYPLGKWPLLAKYEASECLDVDDDRLDFIPHAKSDRETVFSKFTLASFGGGFYVNPQIHKGWGSITLSLDSATDRVEKSGVSCYQSVEVGIKAWPHKYQKLYVVIDKAVRYELVIEKS